MYDYRCKDYENLGQNMPMAYMPIKDMTMKDMPMMNMPMMNMPMMNMPMMIMNDEDLKSMYPKVYIRIYPIVKYHYDMIVAKHGRLYCPTVDEMDHMCKDICDKYKEHYKDEDYDDDCNDDGMRRFGGGGLGNLGRILLIGSLIGGRY